MVSSHRRNHFVLSNSLKSCRKDIDKEEKEAMRPSNLEEEVDFSSEGENEEEEQKEEDKSEEERPKKGKKRKETVINIFCFLQC